MVLRENFLVLKRMFLTSSGLSQQVKQKLELVAVIVTVIVTVIMGGSQLDFWSTHQNLLGLGVGSGPGLDQPQGRVDMSKPQYVRVVWMSLICLQLVTRTISVCDQEHLACFLPATLVLGVLHGLDKTHLVLAANLTRTCYELYHQTATGLSADIVSVNDDPHNGKDFSIRVISFY